MIENVKDNSNLHLKLDAMPTGFTGGSTLFDFQTIEKIGVRHLKQIVKQLSLGGDLSKLNEIADSDIQGCAEFLKTLNYETHKQFINSAHRIASLCDNESAEKLVSCGASQEFEDVRDVAVTAFLTNIELFNRVLEAKGVTQPFPKRVYQLFTKKPAAVIRSFNQDKMNIFIEKVRRICQKKGYSSFARASIRRGDDVLGIILEHGTRKSGYSTLNDINGNLEPESPALRMRHSDYIFVDFASQHLWINSTLASGDTQADLVMALGELFCSDEMAFASSLKLNMQAFDSPKVSSNLRGFNIPGIKSAELRQFFYGKPGVSREEVKVKGPARRGCITDDLVWSADLPGSWKTTQATIIYETKDRVREEIVISPDGIKLSCSPNFSLAVALLTHLRVIPNYGN